MGFKRERGEKKCDLGFQRERGERENVTWDFRERERESRVFVMGCKELLHCRDI